MKILEKIIIFTIFVCFIFNINSYAANSADELSCSSIENASNTFLNEGSTKAEDSIGDDTSKITAPIAKISKMMMVVGVLVLGICMVILGIQWVMAKPSPEVQAKLKQKFIALAISAGVVFGSYTIWKIIVEIMEKIE